MHRVLIYIGHPAQYHFFKNLIKILSLQGVEFKILIKTKDVLENLLVEDGFEYKNIQVNTRKDSKWGILKASFMRTRIVLKEAKDFGAELLMGTDSSIAQAAWLLRKPAITTLEDDEEIIRNLARLTYPFTTHILVPKVCSVGKWENKKIGYDGYMKLAYLHPNYFTPNRDILVKYGIERKFCLIRLAKLAAHHDVGIKGLTVDLVKQVIKIAEDNSCQVFISSEGALSEELKPYLLKIRHTDIHHIMAFADLLISDSQSMSVEACMMGTPNLRFSDFSGRISVLEELEHKYHLTTGFKTSQQERLLGGVNEILSSKETKDVYHQNYLQMLSDKIDVTSFMVWLVKNYPKSIETINANPEYQNRFR